MPSKYKIPNRTRIPDEFEYILFDKNGFRELIGGVAAVLKKQLKFACGVEISVDGFEGYFDDVNTFLETINAKEWAGLKNISVYFYPKDKIKHGFSHVISARFGGYSNSGPGLRISYGQEVNDLQKIAIKQDLEVVLSNHSRDVVIKDDALAFGVVFVGSFGLIYAIYNVLKDRIDEVNLGDVILVVTGIFWLAWLTYLLIVGAHHKIIPHFEAVESSNSTRMKRIGKVVGSIIVVLGLVGSILSIIQSFFP